MSRRPVLVGAFVALVALSFGPLAGPASAADRRSNTTAQKALAFFASQQRSDGGFGQAEAGFPGFETPDVVLAVADAAQPTLVFDRAAALTAVRSMVKDGHDGLHYLDDFADGGIDAGKAAKLVLVADAVGLDPTKFDPDGDGAVNLVSTMDAGRQSDGTYGAFNATLQVLVADAVLGRPAPADTVAAVVAAQQANGGWNFSGDPSGTDEDVDSTSRAVQALVAGGQAGDSTTIRKAMRFLADHQNADGSWSAFGSPDPNSTAEAILALEATGFSVADRCWRDVAGGTAPKTYVSPDDYLRGAQVADGHIASSADDFGINTFGTSQAVQALLRNRQPVTRAARRACPTTGYRLVASDGGVFAHGDALFAGSTGDQKLNRPIVATASTPSHQGYWLFASDGGVFSFGDADFYGSTGAITLNSPIVAAAATPTGGGYWLFAADGGVFAFGDAGFLGSEGSLKLNRPIVAAEASSDGRGYWLFAGDGGVFTHGDAAFEGSTGGQPLNQPVVAAAASRTGHGYWLVAADGGVFALGDAPFLGSQGGAPLNKPIVTGFRSGGDGYYLVASDGGVFTFGDAPFLGSEGGGPLNQPIVAGSR